MTGGRFVKERELELVALISEIVSGHGHTHYGYWPEGAPAELSMRSLAAAQEEYVEKLVSRIPAGTERILDVGSGTGSVARRLLEAGYEVECVCPSSQLNELARRKLPADTVIHERVFEDFNGLKPYDALIFPESFHYIALDEAIAKIDRFARDRVIIFDRFEKPRPGGEGGGGHREFLSAVSRSRFDIAEDIDMTDKILPTFLVHDHIAETYLRPYLRSLVGAVRAEKPLWHLLLKACGRRLVNRMSQPSRRYDRFMQKFEYRLIVLERRQEGGTDRVRATS